MRILQINSVYGFASTGKIVANIHENLLNEKHESFVIYSRKKPKNAILKNVIRIYSPVGVALHAVFGIFFDKHGLYSRYSTKKILEVIERINPDIVHLHVIHGFYLNYPMLFQYLKKRNSKIIWTLHDCWEYTGYCAYYDYNQCDGWKQGCNECKFRNTYPYRILSHSKSNFEIKKNSYRGANMTLVSPSDWLNSEIENSMMSNLKHLVIHNDVKLEHFYFEETKIRERKNLLDKEILLCVANVWTKQKGFNEIRKLAKLLRENQQIVMIGLSNKQMRVLPHNIRGIGRVEVDELRKWYSTADVFLNCTLEDNYPTVNLEAKACGLPIISYRTGGSPEMLDEHDIIVDKYDLNTIIESISKVKRYLPNMQVSKNEMFKSYLGLYENCLKEKL